jgi:copper chaperone CopZ
MINIDIIFMEPDQNSLVYTLQLSKINCTNCEAKIKKHLTEEVTSGLAKVSVNILQEKVNLVLTNQKAL